MLSNQNGIKKEIESEIAETAHVTMSAILTYAASAIPDSIMIVLSIPVWYSIHEREITQF